MVLPRNIIIFYSHHYPKEGANKQVISSQADSLIKISRIWADFFPANTSNQPI
ncbi:ABC transporter [Escherichia coli]|nr:ABC transporter [Escherichia coli]